MHLFGLYPFYLGKYGKSNRGAGGKVHCDRYNSRRKLHSNPGGRLKQTKLNPRKQKAGQILLYINIVLIFYTQKNVKLGGVVRSTGRILAQPLSVCKYHRCVQCVNAVVKGFESPYLHLQWRNRKGEVWVWSLLIQHA